jgi:long-chain acyl-CoA synthetase
MSHQSIYELFVEISGANPDKVAYRFKRDGAWIDVTWAEQRATVGRISRALIALGVNRGDGVAILSRTRLEWVQCDFGIVNAGGVTVGIYQSNLGPDCAYIAHHSDSVVIFAEDETQLEKIVSTRSDMPGLRQIIVFDGPSDPANDVLSWDDFLAKADAVEESQAEDRGLAIRPDDLASLVYTSGTTGVPKGAMITHKNLLFTSDCTGKCLYIEPHYITLLFLPLAHVYARLIVYCCMAAPVIVAFAEDITKVADNLREIRPHFMASVPRIYEKVYDKILSGVEAAGGVKEKLFNWALGVGRQVSELQQARRPIPAMLGLKHRLANRLVFHKIQAALGGRLVYGISGAAPLNKAIAEFFHACGVLILEGIGMTENTSFSNVNRIDGNKFGTVGPVGPGIEMKLAPDGEVLYRGDNVMRGYFKNPEATAETIDAEGWLHTGENVAPQRIERVMRTSHYIAQAVAYGDKRRYITALVTLDPENIRTWADEHGLSSVGLEQLASHPEVHKLIDGEVQRLNGQLASFETVKRFHIVPRDFSIEEGELTPTLKIKRKVVVDKHREALEALYAD